MRFQDIRQGDVLKIGKRFNVYAILKRSTNRPLIHAKTSEENSFTQDITQKDAEKAIQALQQASFLVLEVQQNSGQQAPELILQEINEQMSLNTKGITLLLTEQIPHATQIERIGHMAIQEENNEGTTFQPFEPF